MSLYSIGPITHILNTHENKGYKRAHLDILIAIIELERDESLSYEELQDKREEYLRDVEITFKDISTHLRYGLHTRGMSYFDFWAKKSLADIGEFSEDRNLEVEREYFKKLVTIHEGNHNKLGVLILDLLFGMMVCILIMFIIYKMGEMGEMKGIESDKED